MHNCVLRSLAGMTPMFLLACLKRRQNGSLWAALVKSITGQSVKDVVLLEFWARFTARASMKNFAVCCRPKQVLCMMHDGLIRMYWAAMRRHHRLLQTRHRHSVLQTTLWCRREFENERSRKIIAWTCVGRGWAVRSKEEEWQRRVAN